MSDFHTVRGGSFVLSTSYMLMSFLPLPWCPLPFGPIRMTFPPPWWPAPACPWKSFALWRVRVRVQRSLHPRRSSTESMTWVRLPDLINFYLYAQREINLADGPVECIVMEIERCGFPALWRNVSKAWSNLRVCIKNSLELTIHMHIRGSTFTAHFK